MKKTILTTALLLLISGLSWGQGKETFDNAKLNPSGYTSDSFVGSNGITWSYVLARGIDAAFSNTIINGKTLEMGEKKDSTLPSLKSGVIAGGIGELRFTYRQLFWHDVELEINIYDAADGLIKTITFKPSNVEGAIRLTDTFDISYSGDFKIEIKNIHNQYGQTSIDDLEWSAFSETLTQNPFLTVTPRSLSNFEREGANAEQTVAISGINISGGISIATHATSSFEISKTSGNGFVANNPIVLTETGGNVASTNIYIRLKTGITTGNHTDNLTITSTNATTVEVPLTGIVVAHAVETFDNFPHNSSTPNDGTFTGQDGSTWSYVRGSGDSQINGKAIMLVNKQGSIVPTLKSGTITGGIGELRFTFKQAFLTSNVDIGVIVYKTNGDIIYSTTITPDADYNTIKFSDTFPVGYNGDFTLEFINRRSSLGYVTIDNIEWSAYSKTLPVVPPSVRATPSSLNTFVAGESSAAQTINASGNYLVGNISVAITASSDFEISETSGSGFAANNPIVLTETGGKVVNTAIYVRLKAGLEIGNYSGVLTITSTNAPTVEVPLSGKVKGPADQLVFKQVPSVGYKNISIGTFTVTAQRSSDNSTDVNYAKSITISKASGTGAISGHSTEKLTRTAYKGVATFYTVIFDTDGDYTIQATDGTLTSAVSSTITLNTPHVLENFDNSRLTEDFLDDSFVGNNGFTWSYIAAMDFEEAYYGADIYGNAILLSSAADNSSISSSAVPGGISNFSVKLYKGSLVTESGNRQVELFVNGVSKGTSTPFNNNKNEYIFAVDNINVGGDVIIEIRNITPYPVIIDDILWYGYDNNFNLIVNGNEGWRILSSPTSDNSYQDLLGDIWTQGFTGAKTTGGDASVQTFNTSTNSFTAISDITANMAPGQGFITYVYKDDDHAKPDAGSFPKTLSISGTKNTGTIAPTLNTGAETWTLVGNPYPSIIDWNLLGKTELAGVVYTYDPSISNYINYNGTAGGLTGGKIAPFQGFWVQNSDTATAPALKFTEAAKSVSGGQFYKEANQKASFKMIAEMGGLSNDTYFSFTNEGKIGRDNYDALKLSPLDYVDHLSLATKVEDVLLSINNLPKGIKESVEFPLEISSFIKADGGYALKGDEVTLSLADLKNIPVDWGIVFNNYNTGETIDLRAQESYTFELAAKAKMVKAKTVYSVLSPAGITREKSMGSSGFSITIQPEKTPVNLEPKDEPKVFALEQNYPNPFNPTTTIKYSVAANGPVKLAVYNMMGQKVAELVNSTKQAGSYAISWDAKDVASGMYFYRLSAAGQTITRQMTLIK